MTLVTGEPMAASLALMSLIMGGCAGNTVFQFCKIMNGKYAPYTIKVNKIHI